MYQVWLFVRRNTEDWWLTRFDVYAFNDGAAYRRAKGDAEKLGFAVNGFRSIERYSQAAR